MLPHDAPLPPAGSPPSDVAPPPLPDAGADYMPLPGGPSGPPPALSASPSTATLLNALKRRWWVAAGLGLLMAGGGAAAAWVLLEPKYTAIAQVHIYTVPPWIVHKSDDTTTDRNEFITFQRFQIAQMKSRHVLNAASTRDEVKNLEVLRQQPDRIAWLDEEIKIESKDGDELQTIQMLSAKPEEAKAIVNAVREEYFKEVVNKDREGREDKRRELEKICDEARAALSQKLDTLHQMAEDLGSNESGALAQKQATLLTVLGEKERQLSQVQFERTKAETRLKTYQSREKELTEPTISEADLAQALDNDPGARELQGRVDKVEALVKDYEGRYINGHGYYLDLAREKLDKLTDQLASRRERVKAALVKTARQRARAEYDNVLEQLKTELALASQQESELDARVKTMRTQTVVLGKSSTDMERLKDEVAGDRSRLAGYENRLADLQIELRPNVPPRISRYQEATILKRDQKKQIIGAALAPVLMLGLSCFGVAWWECRKRRIHSADEVATGLGVRVVGAVPALSNPARHLAAAIDEGVAQYNLLESIDAIRTLLLREADVEPTRIVMVTSAVSGEGKTTLASHLASSLARAGRRTLLIDGDLRRPSAHQLFELPLQPGLSEALLNEVHIAEATLSTPVDGLWLVPAGAWDREVVQALAREGMQRIFDKLRNEYDFVVVDSHPVLSATDSLVIGQYADAVILSVMREVSRAPKVYGAYQRLATLGIRVFGAVVNGLPADDLYGANYQYAVPAGR